MSHSGELSLGCLGGSIPVLGSLMRAESPEFSLWFLSLVWGRRGTRGRLSSFVDELRGEVHFPCYLQAETGPDVHGKKEQSCVLQNQREVAL